MCSLSFALDRADGKQMQRLKASHVVPDVLPGLVPTVEVTAWLSNGKRLIEDTLILPEDVSQISFKLTSLILDRRFLRCD